MPTNQAILRIIVEKWSTVNANKLSLVNRLTHCRTVTQYGAIYWGYSVPLLVCLLTATSPSSGPMMTYH